MDPPMIKDGLSEDLEDGISGGGEGMLGGLTCLENGTRAPSERF